METASRYLLTFLLNALWQIPIVAFIAVLARWILRNGPASYRHAVYVTALIASLVLPVASMRTSRRPPQMQFTVTYTPGPSTAMPITRQRVDALAARAPSTADSTVLFPRTIATVVLWMFLAFVTLRGVLLVRELARTLRLRNRAVRRPPSLGIERVWERCLRAFGIGQVELYCSGQIAGPVTAGVWRRIIVLPDALFAETSEDVLTTAIGHEMAHIARNDFVGRLLYELFYLPVSFHPAAWLIHREIERTREMSCDELVTAKLLDPRAYAQSIVTIAATMSGLSNAGYTLGVFDGNILEDRIRRLLERPVANLRHSRLLLAAGLGSLMICAITVSGLALSARAQGGTYNEMKIAESAYNAGDFATAVQHFDHAVKLEPSNLKAKLFLANALLSQYFAGERSADSPLVAAARQQYLDVLAVDSANLQGLRGMVTIAMQTRQPGESRQYALKMVQVDPNDKSAYYTVGVLDWATVYPELQRAKESIGGRPEDYSIAVPAVRKNLRDQYQPVVDEGTRMLEKAIALDPSYDDAMAYLNLMYRLKAAMTDGSQESAAFIATADQWVGKALATRKQRASAPPAPLTPLDIDGPAPGPVGARLSVAPPPPPPPPKGPAGAQPPASPAPPPGPKTAAMPGQYWQVVGNESGTPAMALFRQLRQKGFPAVLLAPDDKAVRVLVGPYFDAATLQKAKPEIEKAGYQALRVW